VVPADHAVRRLDAVLDLGWIHKELAPFYTADGHQVWEKGKLSATTN
jgi:hypothetical protein